MSDAPSTLFVLWADADAPFEEEVRVALAQAGLGVSFLEEHLDLEPQVSWATLFQTDAGCEWAVWCEPLDGLLERSLFDGVLPTGPGEELDGVRWVLGIEGAVEGDRVLDAWRDQLKVAQAVALPGLLLVWDDIAHRALLAQEVEDLVGAGAAPPGRSLYVVRREADSEGVRLRTAGLSRIGVPEVEVCGVPGDAMGAAHAVLEAVAERLLDGVRPGVGGVMELGESLRVRAIPRSEASNRLSPGLQHDLANPPSDELGETWLLLDVL